jgi:hypothetical protein
MQLRRLTEFMEKANNIHLTNKYAFGAQAVVE